MKVLLATDGSQNATKAAKFLLRLPSTDQIELTVLTVTYNPIDNSHGNIQPWFAEWNKHERDMVESHHAELREMLADRFASLSLIHRKGNATQTILNIAKTLNTDLIVMGAVGHSMISRMLLGSISDEVATRADMLGPDRSTFQRRHVNRRLGRQDYRCLRSLNTITKCNR